MTNLESREALDQSQLVAAFRLGREDHFVHHLAHQENAHATGCALGSVTNPSAACTADAPSASSASKNLFVILISSYSSLAFSQFGVRVTIQLGVRVKIEPACIQAVHQAERHHHTHPSRLSEILL